MLNKIKKFFKKRLRKIPFNQEKGVAPILLLVIPALVGLIATGISTGALAGMGGLTQFGNIMFGAFMGIIRLIVGGFLAFSSQFLEIIMRSDVIKIVNDLSTDKNIQGAWGFIRNFANMFIALGFVIVGIGTALRIQEYEAKKLLVPLILVALLVNFTYWLWFDIFEVSNNIMNSFLDKSELTFNPAKRIGKIWQGIVGMDSIDFIIKGSTIITMELLWATTYFTYALLLLLRLAAIPILIIFSPIAFVCLVFKFSQNVWEKWLNQFIGWCLFGIFAAIAIYVSNILMTPALIGKMEEILVGPKGIAGSDKGMKLLLEPFVYILPLGALLFGLLLGGAGALAGATAISGGIMATGTAVMAAGAGGIQKMVGAAGGAIGAAAGKGAGAAGKAGAGAGTAPGGALAGMPGGISGAGAAKPTLYMGKKYGPPGAGEPYVSPTPAPTAAGGAPAPTTSRTARFKAAHPKIMAAAGAMAQGGIAATKVAPDIALDAIKGVSGSIGGTFKGVSGLGGKT